MSNIIIRKKSSKNIKNMIFTRVVEHILLLIKSILELTDFSSLCYVRCHNEWLSGVSGFGHNWRSVKGMTTN